MSGIAAALLPGVEDAARWLRSREPLAVGTWDEATERERQTYRERACAVASIMAAARERVPVGGGDTPARRMVGPISWWFARRPERREQDHVVVPRVLAQSMPTAWQRRLADLLDDLDASFRHVDQPEWQAHPVRWVAPLHASPADLDAAGIEAADDGGMTAFSRGDQPVGAHTPCVPVPVPVRLPDWRQVYIAPVERGDR